MFNVSYRYGIAPVLLFAAVSCGKQTYETVNSQAQTEGSGYWQVPPQVDVVIGVDDSGSSTNIQSLLQGAVNDFAAALDANRWDYRITTVPLTTTVDYNNTMFPIVASKFDSNFGRDWVPPFPRAPQTSTIPASYFRKPADYVLGFGPQYANGSSEPGVTNIISFLNGAKPKSYFIRPTALTVVFIMSNGDDTSEATSQNPPYLPPSTVSGSFVEAVRNAKGAGLASTMRVYSAVSTLGNASNCLGGNARQGVRYMSLASQISGGSFNLCANADPSAAINSMFNSLQAQINTRRYSYLTAYLALTQEPNPDTIRVYKIREDGSITELAKSDGTQDGFQYAGYITDQPSVYVDDPGQPLLPVQNLTGYAIRLVGGARLQGKEQAIVDYLPKGVTGG